MTKQVNLSKREVEVLTLASYGYTSGIIAEKLKLSTGTVENHRNAVIQKLDANNIVEAVALALRKGIIV